MLNFCSTRSEVGLEKRPYLNTLLGGGCFLSKLPDAVRVIRLVRQGGRGPYSAPDCVDFPTLPMLSEIVVQLRDLQDEPVLPRSTSMLC
jgi:hypothetical protein